MDFILVPNEVPLFVKRVLTTECGDRLFRREGFRRRVSPGVNTTRAKETSQNLAYAAHLGLRSWVVAFIGLKCRERKADLVMAYWLASSITTCNESVTA